MATAATRAGSEDGVNGGGRLRGDTGGWIDFGPPWIVPSYPLLDNARHMLLLAALFFKHSLT